tara:strand:- start:130 stop:528 length:399 start_codon:yes stop_codon:yes gene_type:complete
MINPPNNNKFIGLQDQQTLGQLNDPLQAEQDFLAKRMSQPVPVPGDQSPMMQTNYPHAGKPYVVNKEKTGTSKDTLFLPKDTYVSKNGLAEDSDIDDAARKAAADNIYNYTGGNKNFNFEYLEDQGKVKYKK